MKYLKYKFLKLILVFILVCLLKGFSFWDIGSFDVDDADFPYRDWGAWSAPTEDTEQIAQDQIAEGGFLEDLGNAIWMGDYTWEDEWAYEYIETVINYFLAIVAFVALMILLGGFGFMFFSSHEDWFNKAKKYVLNSSIAILVIGVSWLIVSFVFYIVDVAV